MLRITIHSRGGFYALRLLWRGLRPGRKLLVSTSNTTGQSGTDGEDFGTLGRGYGAMVGEAPFAFRTKQVGSDQLLKTRL